MDIDTKTNILLQSEPKRRAWIIYQLSLQDKTLASIAREAGVSRQALWQALIKPYPKAERIIADALNIKVGVLFPDRYDSNGMTNRKLGRPKK
jgi:Ner family transcriptional regulator